MKIRIKNHISYLSIPVIHAIPGKKQAIFILKIILKGVGFFFPPRRKFYYREEQAAFKNAMDIKKNSFPGQGPPL